MTDLDAIEPERSAKYARIAYVVGIALGAMAAYLATTLTYKTAVVTFADGSPDVVRTNSIVHGSTALAVALTVGPVLVALIFAGVSELALRDHDRCAARAALALAALAVVGTLAVMFTKGVVYFVPWAMALAGSVTLTLQALDERAQVAG
ncbi:MAG: hypothetical protein QM648_09375 [Solirubrobacterales bacterium]